MNIQPTYKPSTIEAYTLTALIIFVISIGIIKFELTPHIPIIVAITVLILYGLLQRVPFVHLQTGLANGAMSGLGAVFLLFFIGILLAAWMISGTIPTLIYTGFAIVTPNIFYAIVFIVTSLIGIAIGSSLTTVATVGVAFIGIAATLDLSMPIMAGAIVSGAFFGDKMSPLSDTTNLASTILRVDLFEHIRNMGWTTIPAFIVSTIFFAFISPSLNAVDFSNIEQFQQALNQTNLIHWYSWIPLILLVIFSIQKVPALISLIVSSIVGIFLSFFHMAIDFKSIGTILFSGFVSTTGNEAIDALLTRGGIESMFFTISLVLLALSMGGLLFTLGIFQQLINSIEKWLSSVTSVITAAALTAVGVNVIIGEQYLAILLTGESFEACFEKVGLARKNLARVLEDAGTVINPLVPWSVCGVFISSVLEVSVLEYLPFALFCLLSPIFTILTGITGKTLTYLPKYEK